MRELSMSRTRAGAVAVVGAAGHGQATGGHMTAITTLH